MKTRFACCVVVLAAGAALADEPGPQDEVKALAKKLAEKGNYSWTSTSENDFGGRQMTFGPNKGKIDKAGHIVLSLTLGENTTEAIVKGERSAIKTPDGWVSAADAADAGGQQNRGRFVGRMLANMKPPAVEAQELAAQSKELKKSDDGFAGDLTDEGVKGLLSFGRRPDANVPAPTNTKGTAKFTVKDGQLVKYVYHVQGTIDFNGQEVTVDRTNTVEIKDAGTTKVEIPEEAKKFLVD